MTHSSPKAGSRPDRPSSPLQDHAELAKHLRELQLSFQEVLGLLEPPIPAKNESGQQREPDPDGETRCFYFSRSTVHKEREMLRKYHAEDFRGLLEHAHRLLVGLVKLMKGTHHDLRVKGPVIVSLGHILEQVASVLLRMRNVYDNVERVD